MREKVYVVCLHDTVVRKVEGRYQKRGNVCTARLFPWRREILGCFREGGKSFISVDCNEIPIGLLQM